ncbi:hypothetical protein L2Y96_14185 [Luteibacter aegosomaticola]|uniref:GFA family protein n=1 Tax=Luteibacter aegosomaticola TaxID=2911538 RepID=UPI001FFB16D1|nr:hypothetical protein [Luteibacter aegosomaticola]UPG88567.1 hypothetical protein L2Y96_14185 [Luteibacter aegosomaticola]
MQINGACHCGNLAFELEWPADTPVPVRACGCTFCQKHGAEWTAHPQASLHMRVGEPGLVSKHRFGTNTADFHVCARCGVVTVCTSEIEGHLYAVVNTRAFEDRSVLSSPVSVDFDGEEEEARLGRRTRNWIGRVVVESV